MVTLVQIILLRTGYPNPASKNQDPSTLDSPATRAITG
jgi:hypothetical protein